MFGIRTRKLNKMNEEDSSAFCKCFQISNTQRKSSALAAKLNFIRRFNGKEQKENISIAYCVLRILYKYDHAFFEPFFITFT